MVTVGYKDENVFAFAHDVPWHEMLIDLFVYIYSHIWDFDRWGEIIITSAYRPNDPGCHGTLPLRAFDLRMWSPSKGVAIRNQVNHVWEYDSTRPRYRVATFHDVGNGPHLHFQVHPRTMLIRHGK